MNIRINGQEKTTQASTIAELVHGLGLTPERVALERNLEIVPRAEWQSTLIVEGDRFEIVHFVGGG